MYNNIKELVEVAEKDKLPVWKVILENEMKVSSLTEEEIFENLSRRYEVMKNSAEKALNKSFHTVGSLIEGITAPQYTYAHTDKTICGSFINKVMARALSCSEVNASMGKICAAPTAGACGILPAVMVSLEEKFNLDRRKVLEGLLVASGIGAIITKNATVSGAEGGCQAECGVAAAMSAAAAVQLLGGTNDMIENSCCFALMNVMGLVCDPVAGLVQVPCAQRNASQAINGILSADLALAGMKSLIPVDEVVEAMYKVGRMLPVELRETALGGVANTPMGKKVYRDIFGGENCCDK